MPAPEPTSSRPGHDTVVGAALPAASWACLAIANRIRSASGASFAGAPVTVGSGHGLDGFAIGGRLVAVAAGVADVVAVGVAPAACGSSVQPATPISAAAATSASAAPRNVIVSPVGSRRPRTGGLPFQTLGASGGLATGSAADQPLREEPGYL